MELKIYQQRALEKLELWVTALEKARRGYEEAAELAKDHPNMAALLPTLRDYPSAAWKALDEQGVLPQELVRDGNAETQPYTTRSTQAGDPIPHVCMKVPTGGGKTLLGAVALHRILQGDTGFVLWVVPTRAIFEQTLANFRTRENAYRQRLEHLSGGKLKLLEKDDPFTKQDVAERLCLMMLMLPSANRQKATGFLKFFRDSGKYPSFFPAPDALGANKKFAEAHADLEKTEGGSCVKQSLINVLRLVRPTVILDEAHKAYGKNKDANDEFVKSINRLNPRFVLELSATPKSDISNILVDISGTDLQKEEMIKLPIEIHSFDNTDWKYTLTEAHTKVKALTREAQKLHAQQNRYIRPIAVVRVQRIGEKQRKLGFVHSEDVREYLIRTLAVPAAQIRVQSSEKKELAGEKLLSDESQVQWIITKDALKEGWDCSFAYVLALLDNTNAKTAMTQMVGRVMRQPSAEVVATSEALNRCYIYCYNNEVHKTIEQVKAALESEGLTGLTNAVLGHGQGEQPEKVTVTRRSYKKRIFLPMVLHKDGRGWRTLDYDRDILSAVDWSDIEAGQVKPMNKANAPQKSRANLELHGDGDFTKEALDTGEVLSPDYFIRRLTDLIPNPWQAARIAQDFLSKYQAKYSDADLFNNRARLSELMKKHVKGEIERMAELTFHRKVKNNEIHFQLETDEELDHVLRDSFDITVSRDAELFTKAVGKKSRSLFEPVFKHDFNKLEKKVALYLEDENAIYWWHRIAARQEYYLQGWLRRRVYPDFVACLDGNKKLLILETKGNHLKGSDETNYKKNLLRTLEEIYASALDRGQMKAGSPPAVFRMMFEDEWQEKVSELIPKYSTK